MYRELCGQVIQEYRVNIVENSTCWKRMHAHCKDGSRRICKWRLAESYASLFDLLHEIGHIETYKPSQKRCEKESNATLWAVQKIKALGLPLKRRIVNSYKAYIKRTYERGLRRGLRKKVKSSLYI